MIATTRGLVVLIAVTVALAVLVVAVGPRTHVALDRSLVPGFDAGTVTELVFERPGEQPVHVTRSGTTGMTWHEPDAPVDTSTIDAVLSALRGARWHRTAPASAAGPVRATLRVLGTRNVSLSVGAELPGAEQTWIVRDGKALLVDSWVAHALAPDRIALRIRRPLAATQLTAVEVRQRRGVWPEPKLLDDLREALDGIEIVSLAGQLDPQPGEQVLTAQRVGTCDHDRILIRTPEGSGCVERGAWAALTAAFGALEQRPAEQMADRRPLPFEPAKLELQIEGTILIDLGGHPRIAGEDADPDRIRELVVALTKPGELVARPTGKPTGSLVAIAGDGTRVTLELYPQVVVRQGEPVAIRTPLMNVLTRPVALLRDPTRWREDPITITSITVDGITYTRGAVIGEWTRTPPGTVDSALVDALASAVAVVRAPAAPSAAPAFQHRVTVVVTPPTGQPVTHTIELAGQTGEGCAGRVDGVSVALPLQLCTAVLALHAVH